MARAVPIEMPDTPSTGDKFAQGYFAAFLDIRLGNKPHTKVDTYSWCDTEYGRGYRAGIGQAWRAKMVYLSISLPWRKKGFDCMAVYGG